MIIGIVKFAGKVGTAIWVVKKARTVLKTGTTVYKTYKRTKQVTNVIRALKKK